MASRTLRHATVAREQGASDATAIQSKLLAEAAGIAEKAKSMKALDEAGRGHEEYRLRIEKERAVELEALHTRQKVAESQAHVLGKAFEHASIQIVGGDGQFFDKMVSAISGGKALDGFVNGSDTARAAFKEYLDGSRSLPEDLTTALGAASAGGLKDLTLAAVLTQFMAGGGKEKEVALRRLLETAKSLGVDGQKLG